MGVTIVKLITTAMLFLVSSALFAQSDVSIRNGEAYRPEQVATFLRDLHESNDYIISFRVRLTNNPSEKSDWFVLTRKGENLYAYNFLDKIKQLEPLNLPKESLELAWRTFVQNDLFLMKNEKDIANFCPEKYHVYNSYTYEFVLLTKSSMKTLSYYDPEYYDNVCYGIVERKKIINSAAVVSHILSR